VKEMFARHAAQNCCFHGTCRMLGSLDLIPRKPSGLANSCATAIDQKQQYDYKKYSGNDPNNSDIVHVNSPYFSLA
jgi:hypothetical protein